ncbi:MAG: hypothetical protein ACFE89_01050 [Candidatus Hodarchaeota archaeon]
MPTELPEDIWEEAGKKWRYRKSLAEKGEAPSEPPEEPFIDNRNDSLEDDTEAEDPEPEVSMVSAETEVEKQELETSMVSVETELEQMKEENIRLSEQVGELINQVEEIETLTQRLDQANTDNTKFREQLKESKEAIKQKTIELEKMESQFTEAEGKVENLNELLKKQEKNAKDREDQLLLQLDSMAEQIGKLRGVIRKRDEELVKLQKDILTKKEQADGALEEADKLRTVGIVQREAVQDTTVLRRRVNDLEVELDQLYRTLEKDPKYRIYLLIRETGTRTLEELSKVLGVGVFETRRRVQELVRAGLLDLQNDKVKISRRK